MFLTGREFGVRIKPFEPSLYLTIGKLPAFEPVPGIDRDFVGLSYGARVFPGPFQDLKPGATAYRLLFPVPLDK